MSDFTPVIVFVSVILFFVTVQMYNSFIKYRNQIEEEWSGIDVALKRRFNLIPNLVSTVQSYAKHEIGTMEAVTGQRSDTGGPGNLNDREAEESRVSRALNQVLAVAESYPDLKASANYLSLQNALNEVEAEILQARRRYNSSVRKYNTGRVVSEQPDGETVRICKDYLLLAGTGDSARVARGYDLEQSRMVSAQSKRGAVSRVQR